MKRVITLLTLFALLFTLSSCGRYVSSYMAVGLVRSQTSHSCKASFLSLEGRLVYKLKKTDDGNEGNISYTVEVDEGEVTIYYDIYGIEEELVRVKSGESASDKGGYIEGGKTVYIIIEADEKSRGKVSVELNSQ